MIKVAHHHCEGVVIFGNCNVLILLNGFAELPRGFHEVIAPDGLIGEEVVFGHKTNVIVRDIARMGINDQNSGVVIMGPRPGDAAKLPRNCVAIIAIGELGSINFGQHHDNGKD